MRSIFIRTYFLLACAGCSLSNANGMEETLPEETSGIRHTIPLEYQWVDKDAPFDIQQITRTRFSNPENKKLRVENAWFCLTKNPQHYVESVLCGSGISDHSTYKDEFLVSINYKNNCKKTTSMICTDLEVFGIPSFGIRKNQPYNDDFITFALLVPNEDYVRKFFSVFSDKNLIPKTLIDILIENNL